MNVLVPAKLDYMDYMNTKELLDIDIQYQETHELFSRNLLWCRLK